MAFLLNACICIGYIAPSANGQAPPSSRQFEALKREYDSPPSAPRIVTDEDRVQYVGQVYKHHTAVAQKLLDLARKYPDDPAAIDALIQACWMVNSIPWPVSVAGSDPVAPAAVALLVEHHVASDKLAPLCERISYGSREEYETLLRAVIKGNPHKPVRAAATVGLAHYLFNRSQKVELLRGNPELAADYRELFGDAYLSRLLGRKAASIEPEVTRLLETASKTQGQELLPAGDVVSQRARSILYEMRHLAVGKLAPEIEGFDQDGVAFKLSEYRGKVVLLDFWSWV